MPKPTPTDPYAPPPMHHDRSGGVVRIALLGVMLGAAGLGYAWLSGQERTPLAPPAEEQQMADAGYTVSQPEAVSEAPPPVVPVASTPAPAPRRAPTARVQAPTPAPETTPAPEMTPAPTPIPPVDIPPPSGAVTPGE